MFYSLRRKRSQRWPSKLYVLFAQEEEKPTLAFKVIICSIRSGGREANIGLQSYNMFYSLRRKRSQRWPSKLYVLFAQEEEKPTLAFKVIICSIRSGGREANIGLKSYNMFYSLRRNRSQRWPSKLYVLFAQEEEKPTLAFKVICSICSGGREANVGLQSYNMFYSLRRKRNQHWPSKL